MDWILALISGVSGVLGSIVGAIMTSRSTKRQLKEQYDYQNKHRLELWKREEEIGFNSIINEVVLNLAILTQLRTYIVKSYEINGIFEKQQIHFYRDKWNKHSDLISFVSEDADSKLSPFYHNLSILNDIVPSDLALINACIDYGVDGKKILEDYLNTKNPLN